MLRTAFATTQTSCGITFSIEQLLHLTHHAKVIVIEQTYSDRGLLYHSSCHLLHIHLKSTVTGNTYDISVPVSHFCTKCCRKTKSHCSKATGSDHPLIFIYIQILAGPHLVLTYISNIGNFIINLI